MRIRTIGIGLLIIFVALAVGKFVILDRLQSPTNTASHQSESAEKERQATEKSQRTMSADGAFGLDGYCPVSLCKEYQWVRGDERWRADYMGQTYLFASEDMQREFNANPDRFCPKLGGYDPVRYVDGEGELIAGKREHGVFHNARIVLFADEDSLNKFAKRPERYASARLNDQIPTPSAVKESGTAPGTIR